MKKIHLIRHETLHSDHKPPVNEAFERCAIAARDSSKSEAELAARLRKCASEHAADAASIRAVPGIPEQLLANATGLPVDVDAPSPNRRRSR